MKAILPRNFLIRAQMKLVCQGKPFFKKEDEKHHWAVRNMKKMFTLLIMNAGLLSEW